MTTETTTTKTIEELKAELAAAELKLYEEKRALAEQERQAMYAAEQAQRQIEEAARKLTYENVAKEIVAALKVAGFKNPSYDMSGAGEFPIIKAFDNATQCDAWSVKFEKVYASGYSSRHGFEVKVIVGDYGNKHTYPMLKAGGYNYAKIATTAWENHQAAIAKSKRETAVMNNKDSNERRINNLTAAYGKPSYEGSKTNEIKNVSLSHYTYYNSGRSGGRSEYSYRSDNDLMLKINHITEENAAKLIEFMIENGMTETK